MKKTKSNPVNNLARARPRLIATQDIIRRISNAGLMHLKSFMRERDTYFSKRSPESIHQMRVAIRRLRTVIEVASRVTTNDAILTTNSALRDFARHLGQGRDQDILIGMLQQIPSQFHYDLDAQEAAVYGIIALRDKAYLQVDEALRSTDINTMFERLVKQFHENDYQLQPSFSASDDLDGLILDQFLQASLKRGRKLIEQDLVQKHRLRISLKKLRYALEFLALDRSDTARAREYRKVIERILGHLGAANDAFTASRIARESLSHANGQIHIMAGMIAGWHGRAVQDNEKTLLRAWQSFKSQKAYWN